VDWKLELVVVPVSDVDRAKEFYVERCGFRLDVDHRAGDDFRVVQVTPPGSACSITLMKNLESPGSLQGLHLIVSDIDAARDELLQRGVDAGEIFHFVDGNQQLGPDPERNDYGSFLGFSDPDGNGFVVQEVRQAVRRGRPSGTDAEAEAAAVAHLGWLFPPTGGANHLSKFEAPAVRRACRGSTGATPPPGAGGCPTRGVETPCARRSAAQGLIPGVLAAA
jgi:catechol 2,3-dioxygenase-like lactoylglutathione lyase family enzyme